jgi:hypothetical protein
MASLRLIDVDTILNAQIGWLLGSDKAHDPASWSLFSISDSVIGLVSRYLSGLFLFSWG